MDKCDWIGNHLVECCLTKIVVFAFILSVTVQFSGAQKSATVTLSCDDTGDSYYSMDGGTSWTIVGNSGTNWRTSYTFTVDDVTSETVILHDCTDSFFGGGFIATVDYSGTTYSTTNPLSSGYWESLSVGESSLSYTGKTSGDRSDLVADNIASDAYWVWDGNWFNTLSFQFQFVNIVGMYFCNV